MAINSIGNIGKYLVAIAAISSAILGLNEIAFALGVLGCSVIGVIGYFFGRPNLIALSIQMRSVG